MLETVKQSSFTKVVIGVLTFIPAFALVFWDEILLAGPIIFLVELLGFWFGYVVFCLIWYVMGLITLTLWPKIRPFILSFFSWLLSKDFTSKSGENSEVAAKEENWRTRLVLWLANIARVLGALAAAVLMGPFSWTVLKLLGYKERAVYIFTFVAAWIFGAIWVPFYALGLWANGIERFL